MLQRSGGDRLVELLDHAQRDIGRVLRTRQLARQDREFVTAEPRHQVLLACGPAQSHGDIDQHFVADAVAAQIVDALERVEIEEEDRMRTMTVRRYGQGIFQFLVEAAAVRQAGERVPHRKLMRAPFRLDAARDFAALQQEKVPGQRKQSEAEKRRERQRFVRLDDVLLRGHTRRIWKDVVFAGDQRGDHHHRQQENALPDRRPVATQCARHDGCRMRSHGTTPRKKGAAGPWGRAGGPQRKPITIGISGWLRL